MKERRLVFGMDIGGTCTKYGLIDLASHQIIVQQTLPTETGGLAVFVRAAGKVAGELSRQAGLRIGKVDGGGVGVPGYVDGDQVSLVWESLAFIEGMTLRPALQEELGFPIRMDNDGRTVAMGETYFGGYAPPGAGHPAGGVGGPHRLLSLTLGTGLGVALVVDGRLLEKSSINHLAGHIPIRLGAAACFCGFSDCLESLVGGPALMRNFAQFSQEKEAGEQGGANARKIFELANGGHPVARQAVG
jgi:glucokinase